MDAPGRKTESGYAQGQRDSQRDLHQQGVIDIHAQEDMPMKDNEFTNNAVGYEGNSFLGFEGAKAQGAAKGEQDSKRSAHEGRSSSADHNSRRPTKESRSDHESRRPTKEQEHQPQPHQQQQQPHQQQAQPHQQQAQPHQQQQ